MSVGDCDETLYKDPFYQRKRITGISFLRSVTLVEG